VNVRKPLEEVEATLLDPEMKIVCVNDHECTPDYKKYGEVVKKTLQKIIQK
jgi:hypothetical protein